MRMFLSTLVLAGLTAMSCRDHREQTRIAAAPQWPTRSLSGTSLCSLLTTADYLVDVSPNAIGNPYEVELSPWPGEMLWVTPVTWTVNSTLGAHSVAGATVPPLAKTITTIINAEFKDDKSRRLIAITYIDGKWVTGASPGYALRGSEFTSELDPAAYKASDLPAIVHSALSQSKCSRIDVLTPTRLANEVRLTRQSVSVPLSSDPDAGF